MTSRSDTDNAASRGKFIAGLAAMISEWGAGRVDEIERALHAGLASFGDDDLAVLAERTRTTGADWGYYPPDPVARSISRIAHARVLQPDSTLVEAGALPQALERPVIFLGNHLSFNDANVLDLLLERSGFDAIARALSVIAGPKVYTIAIRRLASLCFGAIKIPQSTTRASGEAVMPMREVARLSAQALALVRQIQARGEHVLIFVEGTRSRTRSMQRALTAVARYLEAPDVVFIPFGLWGSEKLVPLEQDRVYPASVYARFGAAVEVAELRERCGRRQIVADAVGYLIADLLPAAYRGAYAEVGESQRRAREAASALG